MSAGSIETKRDDGSSKISLGGLASDAEAEAVQAKRGNTEMKHGSTQAAASGPESFVGRLGGNVARKSLLQFLTAPNRAFVFKPTDKANSALVDESWNTLASFKPKDVTALQSFLSTIPNGVTSQLHTLDLSELGYNLTDEVLIVVAAKCKKLTSLNVNGCQNITHIGLEAMAESNPKLTSLEMGSCNKVTGEGLFSVANKLPKLTKLSVNNCTGLPNDGLVALATALPNLTSFDASGCWNLSDDGVVTIAAARPKLTNFYMNHCIGVTSAGLKTALNKLDELTGLGVAGCKSLKNDGLVEIAAKHPNITDLNISGSSRLTRSGLVNAAQKLPKLVSLNVGRQFNSASVIQVATTCPDITNLDLNRTSDLTDDSAVEIITKLPKLHNLNLSYCPGLTSNGILRIQKMLPPSATLICKNDMKLKGLKPTEMAEESVANKGEKKDDGFRAAIIRKTQSGEQVHSHA